MSRLPTAVKRASLACAVLAVTMMIGSDAAAQALSTNADATATLAAGVRYRTLSGSGPGGSAEVHVFASPYAAASATAGQGTWAASSLITLTYNGSSLSTTAAGETTTRTVGNLGSLNYIQIQITKNGSTNGVALNTIALNGGSALGSIAVNTAPNTSVWKITGANLTSGFVLSGTLVTTGLSGAGDSNYVQVEVGYVPPADDQGPVTTSVTTAPIPALLNGQVTVTANVNDESTGHHNVVSAEYQLNGEAGWTPMSASIGTFDSPNEDVEAAFSATQIGTNTVCVRGTDAFGNTGAASCQTFLVTYRFTGFFSPIDNDPVNVVKAGQAVPAKWRLTDANDEPIGDAASFVNLLSYPISCTDFAGDPNDSVEEVAAGASGLQYLGDGYWQFNWKTPRSYADSCHAMYVQLDSGALSPVVKFKFKK